MKETSNEILEGYLAIKGTIDLITKVNDSTIEILLSSSVLEPYRLHVEKILRFKDRVSFEKFITLVPAEALLGRIDGLLALRVQDGPWLKGIPMAGFGSMLRLQWTQ